MAGLRAELEIELVLIAEAELLWPEVTGLGLTIGAVLVLVLRVLQRVAVGFTFGLGLTP